MTIEDDARAAVDAELDRLRERFGDFAVVETRVENDPAFYEQGLDRVRETGMLADSGVLVRDRRDRILLIRIPMRPRRGERRVVATRRATTRSRRRRSGRSARRPVSGVRSRTYSPHG